MKKILTIFMLSIICTTLVAKKVNIIVSKQATNREQYAAEYLQKKLTAMGYNGRINLKCSHQGPAEGYTIRRDKKAVSTGIQGFTIEGNDPSGVIYGAVELAERLRVAGGFPDGIITETPQMVMRGTCIGLQKRSEERR